MSALLIGPISGALVAGGVYYGLSNMIQSRTSQLRTDLHILAERLQETPPIPAAPPASDRIVHRPFSSLLKGRWNQQVESLFKRASDGDQDASLVKWGKELLFGNDSTNRHN